MDTDAVSRFRTQIWATPFHAFIGYEVLAASEMGIEARLTMRHDFNGRGGRNVMHGGLVATMLDSACGYLAAIAAKARLADLPEDEMWARLARLVTLDMHVDYIRPLKSESYVARSSLTHVGKTIIRTRGEVFDAEGQLAAAAVANYAY